MNLFELENILHSKPKYRLEQVKKAVFVDLIENWNEAMVLPKEMREELNKKCPLGIKAKIIESKNKKTAKAAIILKDELKVESVLMKYDKDKSRNTVCISSQVGCALGCKFCATGKVGFKRNLSADEIIEQVLLWARRLKNENKILKQVENKFSASKQDDNNRGDEIKNLVFMGMGEPFLNYDNIISAIKILNDPKGFNLGARHFSISTVGIIEGIEKLANEPLQINLAISLHATDDKLRSQIMPVNKKYPIKKILKAVDDYIKKTKRKVMFEYIMIDGINDSEKQARALAKLMKKPLYFINLIPCNPVGNFGPSPQERIEKFKAILKNSGVQVNQRYSFGQDIKAACGQLAGK